MADVKDGSLDCYDCGKVPPHYMVHDTVWRTAMPEYHELKTCLAMLWPKTIFPKHPARHIVLCFECLEKRLGRELLVDDFDLTLPINHGIALGLELARREGWGKDK